MNHGQRLVLAGVMDWLVAEREHVHYAELRPMRTRSLRTLHALRARLASKAGVTMDCSESVTLLCKLAGCHDPSGLDFDGAGNTETLLNHLRHYTNPAKAEVGALVVFDPKVRHGGVLGRHVCMVRRPSADPILFSHGKESDPRYVRLSAERVRDTEPFVLLNVSHL